MHTERLDKSCNHGYTIIERRAVIMSTVRQAVTIEIHVKLVIIGTERKTGCYHINRPSVYYHRSRQKARWLP